MIDSIESLRDIKRYRRCPARRLLLIEANGNLCDQREESSDGTMHNLVSVLSRRRRKRLKDKGEKETLQDFHSGGQEGDGAISRALVNGFSRFGDRDNICLLPDGREVSVGKGKIEEVG